MEFVPDEADQQVVLEEEIDENYEPTEREILEYASWLGIDLETEQELLWIAKEGLKAPLPDDWKPCQTPTAEIYYFNFDTGESIWDHPCDQRFRELYQREKAALQQRRQLAAEGQQQQLQQPQQSQQPAAGAAEATNDQQQQQQQQQQLVQAGEGPSQASVSHTAVEPLQLPLTSPTSTSPSTLPSATTSSMVESPVTGLARDNTSSALRQPSKRELTASRAASAGGSVGAAAASPVGSAQLQAADQEQRKQYRQRLDEERRLWEQQLQTEAQQQQTLLTDTYQQRLWSIQHQLREQEAQVVQQLKVEHEGRMQAVRGQLQARQVAELQDSDQQHVNKLAELHAQQADAEASAALALRQAQDRLTSSSKLSEQELVAVKQRVSAAAEQQALTDAVGKKQQLLQAATDQVNQEVAAEVASYKESRRAAALKELAGELDADVAAAADKLEQQTAELQRLKAAVADQAAILHRLTDQSEGRTQQDLANGDNTAVASQTTAAQQQLASLQQQLHGAQQQLETADAVVAARRAAGAEAEQQLNTARQDISVCESKLAGMKQQLQTLESSIRAQQNEHQQRQADVQVSTSRLADIREELARRQSHLESLDSLYNERQAALRQTAVELAKSRGELSTLDSGLSASLRKKTDSEYQVLEDQLRRARKTLAETAAEVAAKQVALSNTSGQLSSSQATLDSVESSLTAKRRELQDVLSHLQAAAVQEFQDAKQRLLDEEAQLLESERRAMRSRVVEQVESERRAALAAGRRRIEREVAHQVAGAQGTMLAQQQEHVKKWLDLDDKHTTPANNNSVKATSPAPGLRSSLAAVGELERGLEAQERPGTSGVDSSRSLPADRNGLDLYGSPKHATAPGTQRTRSLSPASKGRLSSLDVLLVVGSLQQEQEVNADRRRSGARASTSAGLAAGADAIASAVKQQLEALASGTAAGGAAWQGLLSPQARAYSGLLQHAKQFVRQRRRELQQRQASVLTAQADWKTALAVTEQQASEDSQGDEAVQRLRQSKFILQEQIHSLNDETRQLKTLKAQVQQLEAYVSLLDQQDTAVLQGHQSTLSAVPFVSIPRGPLQPAQTSGLVFTPSAAAQSKQRSPVQGAADMSRGIPQRESSLDRVATALQHALDAATSSVRGLSSSRGTNGSYSSSWHGPGRRTSRVLVPDLMQQAAAAAGSVYDNNRQEGSSPSLIYIDKLREERSAAQNVMQQHSQWLQDFRKQLATVTSITQQQAASNVSASRQPSVIAGYSAQQSSGDALSRVPSSSAALITPRSGQPLTLDLGGQHLVISLVPKSV